VPCIVVLSISFQPMRYLQIPVIIFFLSAPSCAVSSEEAIEESDEYDEPESLEEAESFEEDAAEEEEEEDDEIEFEEDDDQEQTVTQDDVFRQLDFNKDGMLSATEIFAHDESIGARQAQKVAQMSTKFLIELPEVDKDADALISRDEMPSLLEWIQKQDNLAVFNDLDTNKDGHLTAEEIFATQEKSDPVLADKLERHFYDHLAYMDQDGDAMISLAELPALLEVSYDFERESRRKTVTDEGKIEEEETDVTTEHDTEVEDAEEQPDVEEQESSDEVNGMS